MLEAVLGIAGLACLFCCCGFACFGCGYYLFNEDPNNIKPATQTWVAQHYYDPQSQEPYSPSEPHFPSPLYVLKIPSMNGNGMYPVAQIHEVIRPPVTQYPPGHVLERFSSPVENSIPSGKTAWKDPEDVLQQVKVENDRQIARAKVARLLNEHRFS